MNLITNTKFENDRHAPVIGTAKEGARGRLLSPWVWDILAGIGLILLLATLIYAAGIAQSVYDADHGQHETATRICAFNNGDCG